ncbi:MAG: hypothetical protein LLG40_14035 [Deltaproteobacteria bacterium]|nr:hypothetical protein [Deltaproteobacteria bacterium]
MITLIDMKKNPVEVKETNKCCPESCESDMYPYGLQGDLEEEGIAKLGVDLADVTVGEEIIIKAIAQITEVKEEQVMRDGKPKTERRLRWHIKKLGIKFKDEEEDAAEEAFGKDK